MYKFQLDFVMLKMLGKTVKSKDKQDWLLIV